MLSADMLIVVDLRVNFLYVHLLSVVMLCVVMLSENMTNIIMLDYSDCLYAVY